MTSLLQDIRQTLRLIRRSPGFATSALVTIALGVGGTTAVLSVVHAVLLRPLPFPEPDRLVAVAELHPGSTSPFGGSVLSNRTYDAWEPHVQTLEALGGYVNRRVTLTGLDEPERLVASGLTPSVFRLLRIQPAVGRLFTDADAAEGAPPVVVLAHGFWQRRFGGDRSVLGRTLTINEQPHEIVGVAPDGFEFPIDSGTDVYDAYAVPRPEPGSGSVYTVRAVARLAPGATPTQAGDEGTAAARSVERPLAATLIWGEGGPVEVRVVPLLSRLTNQVRPALLLLGVGVVIVLLIACTNVANLFLSQGVARSRELSVRAAIGAGRPRLVRQLVTESLIIALAGGALGVLVGATLMRLIPVVAPDDVPRLAGLGVNGVFLGVALAASLLVGLVAGALPALRGSITSVTSALRDGDSRTTSRGGSRARRLLLVGEAALAVMLLVSALLVGRSFAALASVDAGYDPAQVLAATLHLGGASAEPGRGPAVLDEILTRVRARPPVVAAGAGNMAPFGDVVAITMLRLTDRPGPDGEPLEARALSPTITPGYVEALGVRLERGRLFEDRDSAGGTAPLLVNDAFVRAYLDDGRPAIGRRYEERLGYDAIEFVGVLGDTLLGRLNGEPEPHIYRPLASTGRVGEATIVVRTSGDPSAFAPELRSIVREVDPTAVLDNVGPLAGRVAESLDQERFAASVLGAFAVLAAILAATGLYGVLSYAVSERRREIGVRAALGADRRRLIALVLRQGLGVTAVGLAVGLGGAIAATRLMEGLLFGVTPLDGVSFAAAPIFLVVVALAACLVPALRAAAVDPIQVLRPE